jgi:protein tyrosine phosphatase (PTP) superfamily phosphohydrolase (DUF442 family)
LTCGREGITSSQDAEEAWAVKLKVLVRIGLIVAILALGLTGYAGYLQRSGNFHEVVAGEVYRSNQVTPAELAEYQANYGIRSVLNLRGAEPGAGWYDAEIKASAGLGLTHADFRMSANKDLSVLDARKLIALMRQLPKPLLVHCKRGADRTGLAMALYLGAISGVGADEAGGQLSVWFGHFGVPYFSDAYPMDESWAHLVADLGISRG